MGPIQPPQRKGRVPQYSKHKLSLLHDKFDELEREGIFKPPEDIGTVAEYLNPSFLIKKPSGGHRLVTSFGEVAKYAKPQPALMTDVNSTLQTIGHWKYIVTTDLTKEFYQILLSEESLKYCGVATPFKGVRVYTRCAMGMPGSETALEQLICTVLGNLVKEGVVAKVADDLYCGGDTPEQLFATWSQVVKALHDANLSLSAAKTIIAPTKTTILGWIWSNGTLTASPHRISTLSTCSLPPTVKSLQSFLGAYKFLSRVIPNCSSILSPLEGIVAGRTSQEKISWNNNQLESFKKAQEFIKYNKTITLPRPTDQLWIVTDGSVKNYGLGATLYVTRNNTLKVAGFYSSKLQKQQSSWIPCEIEALSIAASLRHFSPFIIQSENKTVVLTDSKPCVQAYNKLCRGEYSNSARVSTFLSVASRYQIEITHLAGKSNVPSDFSSRNAPTCLDQKCQVCSFVNIMEDATVRSVSTEDVIKGHAKMPFVTRSTWIFTQSECADLCRTHAHLSQGTRPSKKITNIKDVKRYLNAASIASDGLLIVKQTEPLTSCRERIIVPQTVLPGLLTALHIRLTHPTIHQLKQVFNRYFFALDADHALDLCIQSCHECASLKMAPKFTQHQRTSSPPESVGCSFSADVLKLNRQSILLLRESVTSFTATCLIPSEDHCSLRNGLISLAVGLRPLDGPFAVIRIDPAPGFAKLKEDKLLRSCRINLEVGRIKNKNKNPVAERAIQELEHELIRINPNNNVLSSSLLAIATDNLNSRIRHNGLSSKELWTQRDQFTHSQIPVDDQHIIQVQHERRLTNHIYSERSKGGKTPHVPSVNVGDLVYLYTDKNKNTGRNRYLVVSVDKPWCIIRKFVGNQLRNTGYKVLVTECYGVQKTVLDEKHKRSTIEIDSDDDNTNVNNPITRMFPVPPVEITAPPSEYPEREVTQGPIVEEDELHRSNNILPTRRSSRCRRPPAHLNKDFET